MVKGARRKTKAAAKAEAVSNPNAQLALNPQYGQYKDVDEIERELVSKLSEAQQKQTAYNMLIIMDDVIGDIKANENNAQ